MRTLTSDVDPLFVLHCADGSGAWDLNELRVTLTPPGVTLKTVSSTVNVTRPTFILTDNDGDGLFSRGDALEVDEEDGSMFDASTAGPIGVQVTAVSGGRTATLGPALAWSVR